MLNYANITSGQAIAESHLIHPSLFADSIRAARSTHYRYSHETTHHEGAAIAASMAADCERILRLLDSDDISSICAECSLRTIALASALKLLGVPRNLWGDIAKRT